MSRVHGQGKGARGPQPRRLDRPSTRPHLSALGRLLFPVSSGSDGFGNGLLKCVEMFRGSRLRAPRAGASGCRGSTSMQNMLDSASWFQATLSW